MATRLQAVPRGYAFTAPAPALSGEPGERMATCTAATSKERGRKTIVTLDLLTDDGEAGSLWLELPETLSALCRYVRLATMALGQAPQAGDSIEPQAVFAGKRFRVWVGYRRTQHARGGGRVSDELAQMKKDSRDFLRVLDLVSREN